MVQQSFEGVKIKVKVRKSAKTAKGEMLHQFRDNKRTKVTSS